MHFHLRGLYLPPDDAERQLLFPLTSLLKPPSPFARPCILLQDMPRVLPAPHEAPSSLGFLGRPLYAEIKLRILECKKGLGSFPGGRAERRRCRPPLG
jgi:hypothetical protein